MTEQEPIALVHERELNANQALLDRLQHLQQRFPTGSAQEAISALFRHGQELQHLLQQHTLLMCRITAGQVEPNAEELLLHASAILCKSQVILETSKSLLRQGMDARAIASYLQVAEWGLTMCTNQLAEASQLIDEDGEEEVEGPNPEQQPVLGAEDLLRLMLLRQQAGLPPMQPQGRVHVDEELQDTGTSCPVPPHPSA